MLRKNVKKFPDKIKHRQKILEFLVDTKFHPTAEWIYKKLKKKYKDLNLSAVKRNLRILKEEGKIWELDLGGGLCRYDAVLHSHYHFICNLCHNIYDIRIPLMKHLDEKIMQLTGFRILSHRLLFFGLCDECKLKKQNKNNTGHNINE